MYTGCLQNLLKDFDVIVVHDNAACPAQSQTGKKGAHVHRRSSSDPGEIVLLAASESAAHTKSCRWESAPVKKSSDTAPVLKRSVGGPILSIACLHSTYRPPTSKKDLPPTFKRSTERPSSLIQVLDKVDALGINDFSYDFMDDDNDFLENKSSSTHTV